MSNVSNPAKFGAAVTPSDSTELTPTTGLYVGTTGNLSLLLYGGQTIQILNAPVGYHPLQVTKVLAATTASDIVALWS